MSPTQPQQPPVAGVAPHSVDLVVADLELRKRFGVQKYGVAHQHDNGRNHLVDLYQELLDACVYLRAELASTEPSAMRRDLEFMRGQFSEARATIERMQDERDVLRRELEASRREQSRLREQLAEASR